MEFRQHSIDNAPAGSKDALQNVERALGFVPNLFATLAESPVALEGYLALDAILAKGTFTAQERQVLLVAVSSANGCGYCVAAHTTFAGRMRAQTDVIAAARGEGASADLRLDALIRFTHAVVRERGRVGRHHLDAFFGAGFTRAQAIEVAAHVGLKTISNYMDGFAHMPLDDEFQLSSWRPAA